MVNKTNISVTMFKKKDGAVTKLTLPIMAPMTAKPRKNLIESFNILSDSLGHIDGLTLEEYLVDNVDKRDPLLSFTNALVVWGEKIDGITARYVIGDDELNSLKEDDFRFTYYNGKRTYSKEDYIGLYNIKQKMVFVMLGALLGCGDIHHNIMQSILRDYTSITTTSEYSRVHNFLIAHSNMKPTNLVEMGELLHVIPLEDNINDILTVKALIKLGCSDATSLISSIYTIVRETRNPPMEYTTKVISRGDERESSWISSFRQVTSLTLGQIGEYQEYFNDISELRQTYNITEEEMSLFNESLEMCKAMTIQAKYGTYIEIGEHVEQFIAPVFIKINMLNFIKYMEVEQMVNILSVAYVVAHRVSKDLAYLIHTKSDGNTIEETFLDRTYKFPLQGMKKSPSKEEVAKINDLFYGDNNDSKEIVASLNLNGFSMSLKSCEAIDMYPTFKSDFTKYLLNLL